MQNLKPNTNSRQRLGIIAWCLYDWANSAFSTVIITFIFATYFTEKVAVNNVIGTSQWADAIALSGLLIAIISPIVGAVADCSGRRKPWLAICGVLLAVGTFVLWFATPGHHSALLILISVIIANVGMEVGMVFYNAMLRGLVSKSHVGRLSGWAWGLGYAGGLVSLVICLVFFINGHFSGWLPKENAESIRICGPFVALWFLIFAWPLFAFTPDQVTSKRNIKRAITLGLLTLWQTLKSLRQYREIAKFLLARMLYIDGLNTMFAFGGVYAAGTFHLSFDQVILFGIALNVAAGLGAVGFAWLDDYIGSKITILITLTILVVSAVGILIVRQQWQFWLFGMLLSINVGPIQAASRSLLVHMAPPQMMTQFFGLYALSGKATAFINPWLVGLLTLLSGSQRIGMTSVLVFLVGGAILLSTVRVPSNSAQ